MNHQRFSIGFISGLLDPESMSSTSWFPRKYPVARAVSGGALSWISWNGASVHGKRICCSTHLYTCRFIHPSWNPAHMMTDGPALPNVPCTKRSMCLSPCRLCTQARPSAWYNLNLDSSVKIQWCQWRLSRNKPTLGITIRLVCHFCIKHFSYKHN